MMCICEMAGDLRIELQPSRRNYFFLCLFFLRRFLRLCVAILCFFLFFPLGIVMLICSSVSYNQALKQETSEGWLNNYFKSFR